MARKQLLVTLAASCVLAVLAAPATGADTSTTTPTTTKPASTGITRTDLGSTNPANAPGQTLYLQRVTIAPGAKLPEHHHQGTQVAHILAGVLTYEIASGDLAVTRANGKTQKYTAPATIRLRPGDGIVETQGLVHHGENDGRRTVVIELASLLQTGAPLSTPVGTGATGAPLHLTATLTSQQRVLTTVGPTGSIVYGWNQLTGTDLADGGVGVTLLGNVDYVNGSGPISGFVTYTFADGSTLGVSMAGSARAAADGSSTTFAATLGVIGGTGKYVDAKGTGTFTGSRQAQLGSAVSATFDLTLTGVR